MAYLRDEDMVKSPVAGSEKLRDEEDAPSTYAWSASTSHTRKQSTREMRPCRVKTVGGRRWGFHGYEGRVTKKSQRCEEVSRGLDSRSIMSNTFACGLYFTVKCLRMWLVLHSQISFRLQPDVDVVVLPSRQPMCSNIDLA